MIIELATATGPPAAAVLEASRILNWDMRLLPIYSLVVVDINLAPQDCANPHQSPSVFAVKSADGRNLATGY